MFFVHYPVGRFRRVPDLKGCHQSVSITRRNLDSMAWDRLTKDIGKKPWEGTLRRQAAELSDAEIEVVVLQQRIRNRTRLGRHPR